MSTFTQDVKYALRQMLRNPGFTVATVLTLALGIGANTAIFSVVHGVLLRPLPYAHGDRVVLVGRRDPALGLEDVRFSVREMQDYRSQVRTLAGVMEYHNMSFTLLGRGEPDRVQTAVVSTNFFAELGVKPLLGRGFRADDDGPSADPVMLLTYDYWRRRFGGDEAIVGQTLRMNERPITVVGVLPPLPRFPGRDDVFIPPSACPFRSAPFVVNDRNARMVQLYGSLAPGVSPAQAQTEIAAISGRLHKEYPEVYQDNPDPRVPLVGLRDHLIGQFKPTLLVLLAAVGLMLLLACVNVANLTLTRLISRRREVVLRVALGAGRGRLVRQLLTESLLMSLAGGVLGLLGAVAGTGFLVAFVARFTPRASEIGVDGTVLLFTLAASVATGLAFGLFPALQMSRGNLNAALKAEGGQVTAGAARSRFSSAMVIAQVAVSFVLLMAAGLTVRSMLKLYQVNPGFEQQNVLTMTLSLSFAKYRGPEDFAGFFGQLLESLAQHPGVVAAAVASEVPLEGQTMTPAIQIEGRATSSQTDLHASYHVASEDYFKTMGIPLLKGRVFAGGDSSQGPPVVILNQSLAHRLWPDADPVGKRLGVSSFEGVVWRSVVGVVGDVKQNGLVQDSGPGFYLPFRQDPWAEMRLFVRTTADPAPMIEEVRAMVRRQDPDQPLAEVRTLEQIYSDSLAPSRVTAMLLSLFAVLAFVITAIGTSGVVAYFVAQRRQEFGIRMALGAAQGSVVGLVLRQAVFLVVAGLVLGALGSLFLDRLLSSLLFGIEANDPVTFAAVTLLLLIVVLLACYGPARRAERIDPLVAMRPT